MFLHQQSYIRLILFRPVHWYLIWLLPFENMAADYVKETGNHVLYRVTPVFEGSNLVASGVLIEAESVEDKGEDVLGVSCFWSIKELKEQEKRVAKGWFPKRKVDKH